MNFLCFYPGDQVEHALDNPLDEITLGECDMTPNMMVEEDPQGKPATPKKMNLDIDKEPEVKFAMGDDDAQLEGKKAKKKDGKKDKAKRKTCVCNFWALGGLEHCKYCVVVCLFFSCMLM